MPKLKARAGTNSKAAKLLHDFQGVCLKGVGLREWTAPEAGRLRPGILEAFDASFRERGLCTQDGRTVNKVPALCRFDEFDCCCGVAYSSGSNGVQKTTFTIVSCNCARMPILCLRSIGTSPTRYDSRLCEVSGIASGLVQWPGLQPRRATMHNSVPSRPVRKGLCP